MFTLYIQTARIKEKLSITHAFMIIQQPWDNNSKVFNSETIITISLYHAILRQTNVMFHEISNTMVSLMTNFVSPDNTKSDSIFPVSIFEDTKLIK